MKFNTMLMLAILWTPPGLTFPSWNSLSQSIPFNTAINSSDKNPQTFELAKRRQGNNAGRGHHAERKLYRPNKVTGGNNAGGGNYVGFPKSNVKKYTNRVKGN